jgi:predicted N-acetyltransferase YhbS
MIETVPTVRAALPADTPEIAKVVERALAEYHGWDPLMHEAYVAYSLDPTHAIGAEQLVAEIDGRIVGSVLFFPRVMYRAAWPADVATFGTLAVDPTIRRSGIGGHLVATCIELAKAAGATGVIIETMPFMTSAEAFYGRFGFERWPAGDWDGTFVVREFLDGRPAPETILSAWRLDFS